jgi:hypothetical protein
VLVSGAGAYFGGASLIGVVGTWALGLELGVQLGEWRCRILDVHCLGAYDVAHLGMNIANLKIANVYMWTTVHS